jgi:hypothetical protein
LGTLEEAAVPDCVGLERVNIVSDSCMCYISIRKVLSESVDWIYLAQDRDQWRAVANTAMNLRGKAGNLTE